MNILYTQILFISVVVVIHVWRPRFTLNEIKKYLIDLTICVSRGVRVFTLITVVSV